MFNHKTRNRVVFVVIFISGLASDGVANAYTNTPAHTKAKQNPSGPRVPVSQPKEQESASHLQPDGHAQSDKSQEQVFKLTTPDKTLSDWIAFLANTALAAFGCWGVVVATRTLRLVHRQSIDIARQRNVMQKTLTTMESQIAIMREQTEAQNAAVNVANMSADLSRDSLLAMKSKERARISIEIMGIPQFDPVPLVNYRINCFGTTPAFIEDSWEQISLVSEQDSPWLKSDFGTRVERIPSVLPTGTVEEHLFIMNTNSLLAGNAENEEKVKAGTAFVRFRLWIRYRDIFDDTHTIFVSKIYGTAGSNLTLMSLYGTVWSPISAFLNTAFGSTPSWRDSQWKEPKDAA